MADNLYLPQVDYTSRDYASIRDDLIALIPNFTPQWTSRDSNDFGIVLLELFAYLGDLINYQVDRAANESYLNTSTQRDTVIAIAKLLNYSPNDISPATGYVTLSNTGSNPYTVPAGTLVSTVSDGITPAITYVTTADGTANAISGTTAGTVTVPVSQGQSTTETIGTSDGSINQRFALSNTGVITGDVVTVTVGSLAYTKVAYIIDYGPDDPVFTTFTDGAGVTYIVFGDGDSGRVPPATSTISAMYKYSTTSGSLGNVAAGTVTAIQSSDTYINAWFTVTNAFAFTGGADPETTDSIRVNAPANLRSLNRAVSLNDYGQIALGVNGVSKAIAMATSKSAVVLYIAAAGAAASTDSFKTTVSNFFTDKMPPGTTLKVLDFTAAYPYLNATVNVSPRYNAANVGSAVQSALYSLFAFNNVTFNDSITQGDVQAAIQAVEGVNSVTLNDYEKLPALYSRYATTSSAATSSTTTTTSVPVSSSAGLWVGAAVSSIVNSSGTTIYSYTTPVTTITSIPDSTHVVISTTPTAVTIPSGSTINVQGNSGVSDLVCAVNEVPILNQNYIDVFTTGGTT